MRPQRTQSDTTRRRIREEICEEMDALRLLYEAVEAVEDGARLEILNSLVEETQHRLRELLDEYSSLFLRPAAHGPLDAAPSGSAVHPKLSQGRR